MAKLPAAAVFQPPSRVAQPTLTEDCLQSTAADTSSKAKALDPAGDPDFPPDAEAQDPPKHEPALGMDLPGLLSLYSRLERGLQSRAAKPVVDLSRLQVGRKELLRAAAKSTWPLRPRDSGRPEQVIGDARRNGTGATPPSSGQLGRSPVLQLAEDLYWNSSSFEEAARLLNASATTDAQSFLGYLRLRGQGLPQDWRRGLELLRRGVEKGDATAQCYLGFCYAEGLVVEVDHVRAVELYQQAAEQDNATAQWALGKCYECGDGVEKDLAKAVQLYQQAAAKDNATAKWRLGQCFQHGIGVGTDLRKAVELYQQSAAQGNAEAQFKLGVCLFLCRSAV